MDVLNRFIQIGVILFIIEIQPLVTGSHDTGVFLFDAAKHWLTFIQQQRNLK
jgi:hypothetical protein